MQHSANYTGKYLRPAPPILDPREVARTVVSLLDRPRTRSTVGIFPHIARAAHLLFPRLSRNITAGGITTYLHTAEETDPTSGNVLDTVPYGTGIDGGWRKGGIKPQTQRNLLWIGLAVGVLLLRRK
jgi:hypothetical protein